jgi:8-oxo-dGTP pyrophosphatase MutT (NUDIX family)
VQRTSWGDLERALAWREPARIVAAVASKAAVALVFRERPAGLELLFIHRAEHPQDPWSGQMAFPGGRAEDGDRDLELTAIRETAEEIGLDLARDARRLGSLDETRAMSRMRALDLTITPFVFRLEREAEPVLSAEVDGVHWIPLDDLLGSRFRELMDYPYQGYGLKFPCFRVRGRTIWGLTYRMFANLQTLLEEAAERVPPQRATQPS